MSIIQSFYRDRNPTTAEDAYTQQVNTALRHELKGKKIAVITIGLKGYGDYACARKVCRYLLEKLAVELKNLALVGSVPELFKLKDVCTLSFDFDSVRSWGPDLQIFIPIADYSFVSPLLICKDTATLAIREYGYKRPEDFDKDPNVHAYAMGLAPGSLGILIDHSLNAGEKSTAFKSLPSYLQIALHGNQSEEAFDGRFYLGYAHISREIISFVRAIVQMNDELKDERPLRFFFLGKPRINIDKLTEALGRDKYTLANKSSSSAIDQYTWTGKRSIHMITAEVHPDVVPLLHQAAEEEELGTGDQTFSQIISKNVMPAMEVFQHKRNLMEQFYKALPSEIIKKGRFYYENKNKYSNYTEEDPEIFKLELYKSEQKWLLNPEGLAEFHIERKRSVRFRNAVKQAMQEIAETYDFGPRFEEALKNLLEKTRHLEKQEKFTYRSIKLSDKWTADMIPFDQNILLSLDDVIKLDLQRSTGLSGLSMFSDSTFSFFRVGSGLEDPYIVRRTKLK